MSTLRPILTLLDRRAKILAEKAEFDSMLQNPNRFKIAGWSLKEEKIRKMLSKELPTLNNKLLEELVAYEDKYSPFYYEGVHFRANLQAELDSLHLAEEGEKQRKAQARQQNFQGVAASPAKPGAAPTTGVSTARPASAHASSSFLDSSLLNASLNMSLPLAGAAPVAPTMAPPPQRRNAFDAGTSATLTTPRKMGTLVAAAAATPTAPLPPVASGGFAVPAPKTGSRIPAPTAPLSARQGTPQRAANPENAVPVSPRGPTPSKRALNANFASMVWPSLFSSFCLPPFCH